MCTWTGCYDLKMKESGADTIRQLKVEGGDALPPCRDIRFIDSTGQYLICSGNKLVLLDSNLKNNRVIFTGKGNAEVVILSKIAPDPYVSFIQGKNLYSYDAISGNISLRLKTDQPIMDGYAQSQWDLLLTADALLQVRDNSKIERKAAFEKAHTLYPIGEMEFIISSDLGLFHYNLQNNRLSTLIPGVEFNRRALHVEGRKLYAGSINGLYVLDLSELDYIIAFQKRITQPKPSDLSSWVIALLLMLVAGLVVVILRYRGRVKHMKQAMDESREPETKARLTRDEIEAFIRDNLSNSSLKKIVAHFNTNTSMVYRVLEPEKPGDLIQKLRNQRVKTLRSEGKKAREIAGLTGLSETYVRKIWKG